MTVVKGYTIITNLEQVCYSIARPTITIISYLAKVLGTNSSTNKLRGNFTVADLESLLEKYISQRVLCKTCGNPETVIETHNTTANNRIRCLACGHTSSC